MQMFSQLARAVAFAAPLVLIFVVLPPEAAAVWLLFVTIQSYQLLADLGFTLTYSRFIAYAAAGASSVPDLRDNRSYATEGGPNWTLLARISSTMRRTYAGIALIWLGALVVAGSLVVAKTIHALENPVEGWTAWGVLVLLSTLRLYGNTYVSFLLGMDHVAVLRRIEGITWSLITVGALLALSLAPSLLLLVVVVQTGWLVSVLWTRSVARRRGWRRVRAEGSHVPRDDEGTRVVVQETWSRVWRTGSGMALFYGAMQATGVFYAQVGSTERVAAYLLALNLFNFIQQVGSSPFQSKLPKLAALRALGDREAQNALAERGMRHSLVLVTLGFVVTGVVVPAYFLLPGVSGVFVPLDFWALMGVGMFLLRLGSYHLQYYTVTNDIIWHWLNLRTGLILVVSTVALYPLLQWYAFPTGIILSCILYYTWVPVVWSYRAFQWDFPGFILRPALRPAVVTLAYCLVSVLWPGARPG